MADSEGFLQQGGIAMKQSYKFEPYLSGSSSVPVTKITPNDGYYVFT